MKSFLAATKVETVVLGAVERMLLAQGDEDEERATDVLHVSELAWPGFCPRAAYLRITGVTQRQDSPKMRLQTIFEEGHDVHAKWQRWIRRTGRLYGLWLCVVCEHRWMAVSPEECPSCSAPGWKILYKEVPLDARERYLIVGSGDGQLDGPHGSWIEGKTIGIGTVRKEAPRLLAKYSYKGIHVADLDDFLDWVTGKYREEFIGGARVRGLDDIPNQFLSRWVDFDGLWKDTRRPFPAHLRQGHLYGGLAGVDEVVFIYEYKPNQAVKEFVVTPSPSVYQPLLDMALDVKWAVENKREPRCINDDCAQCKSFEKENDERATDPTADNTRRPAQASDNPRRRAGHRGEDAGSEGGTRRARVVPPPQAGRRVSRVTRGSNGAGRQRTDAGLLPVHGMGRLLGRATRAGGDR